MRRIAIKLMSNKINYGLRRGNQAYTGRLINVLIFRIADRLKIAFILLFTAF